MRPKAAASSSLPLAPQCAISAPVFTSIPAVLLSMAVVLGAGCASVKEYHAEPLAGVSVEDAQHAGNPDVELWVTRLPPDAALRVLRLKAEWLTRRATILEVRISAGPSPVPVSRDSFRLRVPNGTEELPLETKWLLAAMLLPKTGAGGGSRRSGGGSSGPGGGSSGSEKWPPEGAIDIESPEEAIIYLGLQIVPLAAAYVSRALSQACEVSKESYVEEATADVRAKTMLPRVVEPGTSVGLLLVFVPRTGAIPTEGRLSLEVRFELERCTWQRNLEVPMN
jgi:hypothetical protein